jgi:hypothetical protein
VLEETCMSTYNLEFVETLVLDNSSTIKHKCSHVESDEHRNGIFADF